MAATLTQPPPALGYTQSPIYVELTTDNIDTGVLPAVTITLSGSGPADGESLVISWLGASYTFTFTDTPATAFDLPTIGAGTLIDLADAVAAAFRECEIITDDWTISRETGGPELVILTYKQRQHITLDATESAAGLSIAFVDIAAPGPALVENLSALLQVWQDTGDPATDVPKLKQHAPYNFASGTAVIDIAPAFAELAPSLPDPDTINPVSPAFSPELTEGNYLKYYLRFADKYGAPPLADPMKKSAASYLAILGSRAFDSLAPTTVGRILHNYQRRDGETFRKPVSDTQPDWVYWLASNALQHRVSLLLYWSDGTTSTYLPFPGTTFTPVQNKCYVMPSGYQQLQIALAPQDVGTSAQATIIGYDFRLERTGALGTYTITVRYDVDPFCSDFGLYLLMSNGMGGCETVRLKGKKVRSYETSSETYRKSRWQNESRETYADLTNGAFGLLQASGQPVYEASSGWYEESYYLDHLQQLPLSDCWLIDMDQKRFMRVIVEGKNLVPHKDDETLFALNFTIRAAWEDTNWNY